MTEKQRQITALSEQSQPRAGAERGSSASVRNLLTSLIAMASLSACAHPMMEAAGNGDTKTVLAYLDQGANVNLRDPELNTTALHWAASAGHLETTRALLDRGADPHATNGYGATPLQPAAANGHYEVVRLLLDRGANVNAQSRQGWTPLHAAARENRVEVVRLLLERGADASATTNDGQTPPMVARWYGHAATAERLERAVVSSGRSPVSPAFAPATSVPAAPVAPSSPPPPPIY